ncbi:MAG: chromate efflux transporter, partial [Anaerolineae bacterium]
MTRNLLTRLTDAPQWRHAGQVIGLFLKIGLISFGGPAAGIALMEQEVVGRRRWLSREHFLDLMAATNLVPGPNAVEMASHIGYIHAGWPGLLAGGASFILPGFLASLALGWVYVQFGNLPQADALFYGINPAVLGIILVATYRLGKAALRDWPALILFALCFAGSMLGLNEVLLLLTAGLAGVLFYARPHLPKRLGILVTASGACAGISAALPAWLDLRLVKLGLFFLKVGALLFGSGMVLFVFIQRDVVERFGWLTQRQLVDAIAVGQMTPGPVLSSATFIGYVIAGLPGALVATMGVFLPSFLIVAMIGPWIPRLRQYPLALAFLRGVNAAVVALILSVAVALLRTTIVDIPAALIMVGATFILWRFRPETFWLVLAGALCGLARYDIT